MRHMVISANIKAYVLTTVFLVSASLLFGCESGNGHSALTPSAGSGGTEFAAEAAVPATDAAEAQGQEESKAPSEGEIGSAPDEVTMEKDTIMVASPDVHHISGNGGAPSEDGATSEASPGTPPSDAGQPQIKFNYDVNEIYDPQHPTLMGLNLKSTAEAVKARFGEPVSIFNLPDDGDAVTVYAYPGFTVGINNGLVLFVEVSSRTINPGLNGFRVGGHADEVISSIGKPTSSSSYVLSYSADDVIIKFDVDPQTEKIQSIKLFPAE
jgi:hypothetical protein